MLDVFYGQTVSTWLVVKHYVDDGRPIKLGFYETFKQSGS